MVEPDSAEPIWKPAHQVSVSSSRSATGMDRTECEAPARLVHRRVEMGAMAGRAGGPFDGGLLSMGRSRPRPAPALVLALVGVPQRAGTRGAGDRPRPEPHVGPGAPASPSSWGASVRWARRGGRRQVQPFERSEALIDFPEGDLDGAQPVVHAADVGPHVADQADVAHPDGWRRRPSFVLRLITASYVNENRLWSRP